MSRGWFYEEDETRIEHEARVSGSTERQRPQTGGGSDDGGSPEVKMLEQIRKELHEANDHLAMIRRIMVWVWIIGPCIAGVILLIFWLSQTNDSSPTPYGLGVLMLLP